METVTVHTAKTTLSQLLARVEAGEEIILARGNQPIARLVPYQNAADKASVWSAARHHQHRTGIFCTLCLKRNWPSGSRGMQLLLDTHVFFWWLAGDEALSAVALSAEALSAVARTAIAADGNDIFVSAASAWEIATKHRIGTLPAVVADLDQVTVDQGFVGLPISLRHGQVAGTLPGPHRDPFDRRLIAQAMLERLVLVSHMQPFDTHGVARLW
jgi:prevent-host-death family protein